MVRRAAALLLVAAACLASCATSNDSASDPTTTFATLPPSFAPTTSSIPRTTAPDGSVVTTTLPPTTVAQPVWPLTGIPGAVAPRSMLPALAVKIDNHPNARPQTGLGQADVVFEEVVEGITRFLAVFHSASSDPVGPIRSARTTDISLLAMLNHPLFAWSGGNRGVTTALKNAGVATDLGASTGNNMRVAGYYRDGGRRAPYNLFTTTTNLWALTPEGAAPPPALFSYRAPDTPAAGVPVAGAKLTMAGTRVLWTWDPARKVWLRTQDERPHTDSTGAQLAPENVVVMFVPYRRSPADPISPEAVTTGEGKAWIFTGGAVIDGTWSRPDPAKPPVLLDASGQPVLLAPGRTWVELTPEGKGAIVAAGASPASVAYPR